MNMKSMTDRRSFLKSGALVAAPLAVMAPARVMADDGTHAKLTRMEDERALAVLTRDVVRQFNGDAASQCQSLSAQGCAVTIVPGVTRMSSDAVIEESIVLDQTGASATAQIACSTQEMHAFEGDTTIEQMARWQGHGNHYTEQARALDLVFSKGKGGWQIVQLKIT